MKVQPIFLVLATASILCSPAFAQGNGDNQDDPRSGKIDRVGDGNSGQGDDKKLRDEIYESIKERARARREGHEEPRHDDSERDSCKDRREAEKERERDACKERKEKPRPEKREECRPQPNKDCRPSSSDKAQEHSRREAQAKHPMPPQNCPPRKCDGQQSQKPVLHAPSNPCRGKPSHGPHHK